MSGKVDSAKLAKALDKYNRRKLGTPIPAEIGEAISAVVDGVASKPNYYHHPYLDDMKGIATLVMIEAVMKRKVTGKGNPFAYFNTICRREFNTAMIMEAGEIATIQVELLGHVASNTNHDTSSTKRFIRHATKTANIRRKFIKKKQRRGSRGDPTPKEDEL